MATNQNDVQQFRPTVAIKKESRPWFTFGKDLTEGDVGKPWEVQQVDRRDIDPEKVYAGTNWSKIGQWTVEGLRNQEAFTSDKEIVTIVRHLKDKYPKTFMGQQKNDEEILSKVLSNPALLWNEGYFPSRQSYDAFKSLNEAGRFEAMRRRLLQGRPASENSPAIPPVIEGFQREGMLTSIPVISDIAEGLVRSVTAPFVAGNSIYRLGQDKNKMQELVRQYQAMSPEQRASAAGQTLLAQLRNRQEIIENRAEAVNALLMPEATSGATTLGLGILAAAAPPIGGPALAAKLLPGVARLGGPITKYVMGKGPMAVATRGLVKGATLFAYEGGMQEGTRAIMQRKPWNEVKDLATQGAVSGAIFGGVGGGAGGFLAGTFRRGFLGEAAQKSGGAINGTPDQLRRDIDVFEKETPEALVKNLKLDNNTPLVEQLTKFFEGQYPGAAKEDWFAPFVEKLSQRISPFFSPEAVAAREATQPKAIPVLRDLQTGQPLDLTKVDLLPNKKRPHRASIAMLLRRNGAFPDIIKKLAEEIKSRNGGEPLEAMKPFFDEIGYDMDGNKLPTPAAAPTPAPPAPAPGGDVTPPPGTAAALTPPPAPGAGAPPAAGMPEAQVAPAQPTPPAADDRYGGLTFDEYFNRGPVREGELAGVFNPYTDIAAEEAQRAAQRRAPSTPDAAQMAADVAAAADSRWGSKAVDTPFGLNRPTFHSEFLRLSEELAKDVLDGAPPGKAFSTLLATLHNAGFPRGERVAVIMADGRPDNLSDIDYARQVWAYALEKVTPKAKGTQLEAFLDKAINGAADEVESAVKNAANSDTPATTAWDEWSKIVEPLQVSAKEREILESLDPELALEAARVAKGAILRMSTPNEGQAAVRQVVVTEAIGRLGPLSKTANGKVQPGQIVIGGRATHVRPTDSFDGVVVGRPNDTKAPSGIQDILKWSDEERVPVEAHVVAPPGFVTPERPVPMEIPWVKWTEGIKASGIIQRLQSLKATTKDAAGKIIPGEEGGGTFNLDGTSWNGNGVVISLRSKNVSPDKFGVTEINRFLAENKNAIGGREFVLGFFRFYDASSGKDVISIDLNIVVPAEFEAQAVATARALGQNSVWNGVTEKLVKTGATGGNPAKPTDGQLHRVRRALLSGQVPELSPAKISVTDQYIDAGFYPVGTDNTGRVILRREPREDNRALRRIYSLLYGAINGKQ